MIAITVLAERTVAVSQPETRRLGALRVGVELADGPTIIPARGRHDARWQNVLPCTSVGVFGEPGSA
jgi:hypothetical protein